MTRVKLAVSIPAELADAAREAVAAGRAASVSAYVAEALAEKTRRTRLDDVLDEMDAEYGPPGREAKAWARRVLPG